MRTLERPVGTRTGGLDGADTPSASGSTDADVVLSSGDASPEEQLRRLLSAAAALDDDADDQLAALRTAARRTTRHLVSTGVLPAALAVDDTDPHVVVARLLSRAWRHTARSSV